ncbi:MAG: NACHT domain-containing protein, partial [Chloroflexi bacterium]|nr:NACHT domain-containing protein [Chloroflexota bacterium]
MVQKFGPLDPKLETTLTDFANDPANNLEPARKVLQEVGADRDQHVLDQATRVLQQAEHARPGSTGGLVGQLHAQGGRVLVAGTVTGTVYQGDVAIYATATMDPRERENRRRMLMRVRRTWIDGYLEASLHGAALQTLGLQERPEAVPDRWGMVVQQRDCPSRRLPPDTSIVHVFDELDGELLILGEPGSGKTILLLELTRALLDRAEHDEAVPMPVIFPLAPWAVKRLTLADWLVDELNQRYDVPRQIGQKWVANDRLLPLLDGLDEVTAERRGACVEAINTYREGRAQMLPGLVVTSRVADYDSVAAQLRLRGAVLLQPLRPDQIEAYLASAGDQLAGVRTALQADQTLQELAASPLL